MHAVYIQQSISALWWPGENPGRTQGEPTQAQGEHTNSTQRGSRSIQAMTDQLASISSCCVCRCATVCLADKTKQKNWVCQIINWQISLSLFSKHFLLASEMDALHRSKVKVSQVLTWITITFIYLVICLCFPGLMWMLLTIFKLLGFSFGFFSYSIWKWSTL